MTTPEANPPTRRFDSDTPPPGVATVRQAPTVPVEPEPNGYATEPAVPQQRPATWLGQATVPSPPAEPEPAFGMAYDAGLSVTPMPAPPGMAYDVKLSPPSFPDPLPPVLLQPAQLTTFVTGIRAEIEQLERYFQRQTRRFRLYGTLTLSCAAAVPVFIAAGTWSWLPAMFGAIAAISGSLQTLYKFQDSAVNAMSLANRLESELVRFETGTTPYSGPPGFSFNQFVDRVTTFRQEGSASFHGTWQSAQPPAAR